MDCKHFNFEANVSVIRLTDLEDSEKVTGYTADITIRCMECKLPFEFIGVPGGVNFKYPTASPDNTELRTPIKPSTDPVENFNAILNAK